ncbi:MAG: hypothetical protein ACK56F_24275 [bacterium]
MARKVPFSYTVRPRSVEIHSAPRSSVVRALMAHDCNAGVLCGEYIVDPNPS